MKYAIKLDFSLVCIIESAVLRYSVASNDGTFYSGQKGFLRIVTRGALISAGAPKRRPWTALYHSGLGVGRTWKLRPGAGRGASARARPSRRR